VKYCVLFITLFVIILSSSLSSAQTFINIYLDESGKAEFFGDTTENLTLPNGIEVNDGKIRGSTLSLTSKNQELWNFTYTLNNAELKVILPKNAVIKEMRSGDLYIERGRLVIYSSDTLSLSYFINDSEINWIYVYLISIFLIIVLIILFTYYKNKKPKVEKKINVNKNNNLKLLNSVLNEREKVILNKLGKVRKVKMSYLRKLCNIPKASFSRHIQELERKGLIKRTGLGKNKFVDIK